MAYKLELIVIEVQVPKGKSILVSCVYVPPKEVNHYTLAHLSATMEKCLDYNLLVWDLTMINCHSKVWN